MSFERSTTSMTGIAVYPGQPRSLHLTTIPAPKLHPDEVIIDVNRVGVCGTDKEIIDGHFGTPPLGHNELIIGHEVLGTVAEVGSNVTTLAPGQLVVATVRRPDDCPACRAGQSDFCLWRGYTEHGIIGRHGFMVERFAEHPNNLIPLPPDLADVGILLEPLSVVEKALRVTNAVQQRLLTWEPKTAVVYGAGPIGLLGVLLLRSLDIDVYCLARTPGPHLAATIIESAGGHYLSTREHSSKGLLRDLPNVDLIFEASGASGPVFDAMSLLGGNGVLILLSLTGGDRSLSIPADEINREFVLGNKQMVGSVNSHYVDFVAGVERLATFEQCWPGLAGRLITARLNAFQDVDKIRDIGGIKAVLEFESWRSSLPTTSHKGRCDGGSELDTCQSEGCGRRERGTQ